MYEKYPIYHLPNTIPPNAVSESRMESWSNLSNVSQNCTLVALGKKSFVDWKVENNTFLLLMTLQ